MIDQCTYAVYALVDSDDHTFYVGCTSRLAQRVVEQRLRFPGTPHRFVVLAKFAGRGDAYEYERRLIRTLQPAENRLANPTYHEEMGTLRRARRAPRQGVSA